MLQFQPISPSQKRYFCRELFRVFELPVDLRPHFCNIQFGWKTQQFKKLIWTHLLLRLLLFLLLLLLSWRRLAKLDYQASPSPFDFFSSISCYPAGSILLSILQQSRTLWNIPPTSSSIFPPLPLISLLSSVFSASILGVRILKRVVLIFMGRGRSYQ